MALVALSMGGTLACSLAENHAEVVGMVLVNPFVDPPADSFRAVLRGILESGTEIAPGVGSDIAKEGSTELAYLGSPIAAALSMFEGIDVVAAALGEIRCPVLLLSSRNDHVVPSSSGDLLVEKVSGPIERIWLEHSYHVATLDNDAELVVSRTVQFVGGLFAGNASNAGNAGAAARRAGR